MIAFFASCAAGQGRAQTACKQISMGDGRLSRLGSNPMKI
jgi:hypothetical protein